MIEVQGNASVKVATERILRRLEAIRAFLIGKARRRGFAEPLHDLTRYFPRGLEFEHNQSPLPSKLIIIPSSAFPHAFARPASVLCLFSRLDVVQDT